MKVFFAADHGGFSLKEELKSFVESLGYEVVDVGAHAFDPADDYPPFVMEAARRVSENPEEHRGVIIGGSGQGEAFAANRIKGVRAVVYYGEPKNKQTDADGQELDLIESTRNHNDSNILSIGGRFVELDDAQRAVERWLKTPFSNAERHIRRHRMIDQSI
ncbi:MAG: RpiB/LacA/LacB family sugar-phosphate isomerase [Patescibacteria group bacterium]